MQKRQFISAALSVPAAFIASKSIAKEAAPSLQGKLLDGSTFSLVEQAGKVTVVQFWATWCGACVEELPDVQAFFDANKAKGLVMVSLAMDDEAKDVREWVAKKRYKLGFGWLPDFKSALGVTIKALPTFVVIGKNGQIAKQFRGGLNKDKFAEIAALL